MGCVRMCFGPIDQRGIIIEPKLRDSPGRVVMEGPADTVDSWHSAFGGLVGSQQGVVHLDHGPVGDSRAWSQPTPRSGACRYWPGGRMRRYAQATGGESPLLAQSSPIWRRSQIEAVTFRTILLEVRTILAAKSMACRQRRVAQAVAGTVESRVRASEGEEPLSVLLGGTRVEGAPPPGSLSTETPISELEVFPEFPTLVVRGPQRGVHAPSLVHEVIIEPARAYVADPESSKARNSFWSKNQLSMATTMGTSARYFLRMRFTLSGTIPAAVFPALPCFFPSRKRASKPRRCP